MVARGKFHSPKVVVTVNDETRERAIQSSSGGCLIADPIKELGYTSVVVDMATVRFSDPKTGLRYTYLTPPEGQLCLLAFDQGWSNLAPEIVLKRAVKIDQITRPKSGARSAAGSAAQREARIAELEAKLDSGEPLTRYEKVALTTRRQNRMKSPPPERPTTNGPVEVHTESGNSHFGTAVVRGGRRLPAGESHPNLLRGRNRHFGAKLADPGIAFQEAVDKAVAERLVEQLVVEA